MDRIHVIITWYCMQSSSIVVQFAAMEYVPKSNNCQCKHGQFFKSEKSGINVEYSMVKLAMLHTGIDVSVSLAILASISYLVSDSFTTSKSTTRTRESCLGYHVTLPCQSVKHNVTLAWMFRSTCVDYRLDDLRKITQNKLYGLPYNLSMNQTPTTSIVNRSVSPML